MNPQIYLQKFKGKGNELPTEKEDSSSDTNQETSNLTAGNTNIAPNVIKVIDFCNKITSELEIPTNSGPTNINSKPVSD